MSELKSEQGIPSLLAAWFGRQGLLRRPLLSARQRGTYAAVSFLMGITYLKVLAMLEFHISPAMLLFTVLGGLCFAVCLFNLIAIWQENG
jgi:hypothetical protein